MAREAEITNSRMIHPASLQAGRCLHLSVGVDIIDDLNVLYVHLILS